MVKKAQVGILQLKTTIVRTKGLAAETDRRMDTLGQCKLREERMKKTISLRGPFTIAMHSSPR